MCINNNYAFSELLGGILDPSIDYRKLPLNNNNNNLCDSENM
jgi:hypothetical protein